MLDGTIAAAGANMLIYATSNRRHLMPEYFSENLETKHIGGEVHPGESVEEKISLSERFGLWVSFYPFSQDDYLAAVASLARGVRRRGAEILARGRGAHARSGAVRAAARLAQRPRRVAVREELRRRRRAAQKSARETQARRRVERERERRERAPAARRRRGHPARRTARCCSRSAPPARRTPATGNFPAASSSPAKRRARRSIASSPRSWASRVRRAAPWLVQQFRLSARARRAPFLPRVRLGRRARRPRRAGVRVADAGPLRRRAAAAREHVRAARAAACRRSTASAWPTTSARPRFSRAPRRRSTAGSKLDPAARKELARRAAARARRGARRARARRAARRCC